MTAQVIAFPRHGPAPPTTRPVTGDRVAYLPALPGRPSPRGIVIGQHASGKRLVHWDAARHATWHYCAELDLIARGALWRLHAGGAQP